MITIKKSAHTFNTTANVCCSTTVTGLEDVHYAATQFFPRKLNASTWPPRTRQNKKAVEIYCQMELT